MFDFITKIGKSELLRKEITEDHKMIEERYAARNSAIVFIYCLWKNIDITIPIEPNEVEEIIYEYMHDPVFHRLYDMAQDIFKNALR